MLETLGGGVVEVGGADLAATVERANVRVVVHQILLRDETRVVSNVLKNKFKSTPNSN